MSAPAISVCIRAYSGGALLERAIASVLSQTFQDFEIVVSDDAGRHAAIAESFADPRVRYSANPRPAGPAANLRRVIGLSEGSLIAVLNEDDEWLPSWLEVAYDRHLEDPTLGVVFADTFWEIAGQRGRYPLPFAPGRQAQFLADFLDRAIPCAACVLKREVWDEGERTLPLEDRMVGDLLLWLRAAEAGWPFYYVDEFMGVFHIHPDQLSWSEGYARRAIATLEAFRFDDRRCEQLRLARLAELSMTSARVHLGKRRFRLARRDVAQARRYEPARLGARDLIALAGARELSVRLACSYPRALMPALAMWRRVRPPVVS